MALRAKGGAAVATLTRVASVIGVRGALKWARCLRQKAMMSSAEASASGFRVTNAQGVSPHF